MNPMIGAALISTAGQMYANRQNQKQAANQMAFQREMSNTSYQRAMSDMRTAGLNPILAAKVGGASTPAGAMANIGNVGAAGVQAYQQASAAKGSQASAAQLAQQTRIIEQNADYLEKNGISELSLKHTVRNIQGTKAAEAFEEMFASGGQIPLMLPKGRKVHYEAAKVMLNILESQGYIAKHKHGAFSRKGYYFTDKAKTRSPDAMRMLGTMMFGVYGNMALGASDSFFGIGE